MKKHSAAILVLFLAGVISASAQSGREKLDKIEQDLKSDVPRLLCIDEQFTTGGQPTEAAFAKLAAHGFRSVLNLRTANEGVDLAREQELAEKAGLLYINIPVSTPKPEDVEAFIKSVKDNAHHPMLIHCASANRVGAFWMIYRVVEQGWSEEIALEEATKVGLTSPKLKSFAQDYIAQWKQKTG